MKKFLVATALLFSVAAYAQSNDNSKTEPAATPSKGFWVIESNIHVPDKYVVYFYNSKQQLIYQEKVDGKSLNVSRKKTQKQLNQILDKALANYAAKQAPANDLAWVSASLKK